MAMNRCSGCLENDWKYKHIDGYVIAICQQCGKEVEFLAKKS